MHNKVTGRRHPSPEGSSVLTNFEPIPYRWEVRTQPPNQLASVRKQDIRHRFLFDLLIEETCTYSSVISAYSQGNISKWPSSPCKSCGALRGVGQSSIILTHLRVSALYKYSSLKMWCILCSVLPSSAKSLCFRYGLLTLRFVSLYKNLVCAF